LNTAFRETDDAQPAQVMASLEDPIKCGHPILSFNLLIFLVGFDFLGVAGQCGVGASPGLGGAWSG
jgi:hypothetical protein